VRELDDLAGRFWAWRARQQPRTRDDIPRLDRPQGWLPETDPDLAGRRHEELQEFRAELGRIRPDADAVPGPVFDVLLRPGVDEARVAEALRLLRAVPATLAHAPAALAGAAREFAELALAELDGIGGRLDACADALAAISPGAAADLRSAAGEAAGALEAHASWLAAALPGLAPAAPVGPERYEWFLREVACVPLTVGEIDAIGRREYDRAVWLELVHRNRNRNVPEPPLPASAADQTVTEDAAEASIRAFYEREDLLSQPAALRRYLTLPMPRYLEPLRFLGMTDELTGPGRLDENGVAYVPEPGPHLPYFYAANARDPRAGIIHEGVHYQQLALSWRNPRPVRRHYYDSGANEGIAFYNEELMLTAGLLDDRRVQLHAAARAAGDR
jgi:hypothetical protein